MWNILEPKLFIVIGIFQRFERSNKLDLLKLNETNEKLSQVRKHFGIGTQGENFQELSFHNFVTTLHLLLGHSGNCFWLVDLNGGFSNVVLSNARIWFSLVRSYSSNLLGIFLHSQKNMTNIFNNFLRNVYSDEAAYSGNGNVTNLYLTSSSPNKTALTDESYHLRKVIQNRKK